MSRIFSAAVIRDIGNTGSSPLLARLLVESGVASALSPDARLWDAFEYAFATLRRGGNRDDYVYRAALTQKVVLGKHNLRTATVLNELRAGKSKADLVVLNGTATAYEIKSERDTFRRLDDQLADYRSVFASVYVVTSPEQAAPVLHIAPDDVGVIALSPRYSLQIVRQAIDRPERTSPSAILATLRVDEAIRVLERMGVEYPVVPNTRRWAVLNELFGALDPARVHAEAFAVLKGSRAQAQLEPLLKALPKPLGAAVLASGLPPLSYERISAAAWQPLSSVLAWG